MKDSYVWFWGGRTALFLVVVCLVTGFAGAQEGEGEGEGETPGQDLCTEMALTTQQAYTLPVLPPILEESLTFDGFTDGETVNIRIWVKVLQYSEHPGDSLTVTAGGLAPATPINWNLINTWQELIIEGLTAAADTDLVIRAVTRTDMPDYEPTLVLVGAVLAGPSTNADALLDILNRSDFDYASNIITTDFELESIQSSSSTGALDDKPWPNTSQNFARLGGLTRPRITANLRHQIVAREEGEGEAEGEDEGEGEGEGEIPLEGWVQFFYGDEELCGKMLFENFPDMSPCCGPMLDCGPTACGPGVCEWCNYWPDGECRRVSQFIPMHLLGSAWRPALHIKVDPWETGSRLIVDDFTLTYVSQALECAIPALTDAGNLIENGDFENGAYPFIIQPLVEGQTNCARITDVIRDIDDACRGDAAAVFDGQVSTTPMVAYCEADALIGRGQTGTLALYGLNLASITDVLLIPELYVGQDYSTGRYIIMSGPSDIEYVDDLERVTYTFRFNGPFNTSVGGEVICTDGRASFQYTAPGLEQDSQDTGVCATVIDTLPPVLVVNSPEGINAAEGWPAVYGTNRVPAVSPGPAFPTSWILPSGIDLTPKNAASFSRQDMHVYLNAGSQVNLSYEDPGAANPFEPLYFSVWAYFEDPEPVDGAGTTYNVQRAGFQAAFYPEPATEGEPPAAISPFSRYRGVRWNGSGAGARLLSLAAVPSLDPPNEMNVTWNVEVPNTFVSGNKYWSARFKFEVSDRANNLLDISKDNAVNIHWLWVTQAEVTSGLNMAEHAPQLTWRLRTPELPGAPPACAPLARFRLYLEDITSGSFSHIGTSDWLQGPLRDTTLFWGKSLRQHVNENKGRRIHLDIIGADETGNVQHDPGPAGTIGELEGNSEGEVGVDTVAWDEEVRDYQNTALDTAVGVRLYHERSDLTSVNDFGGATRVPLPPLCDACYTRVNGNVWFRAMVPAQSGGPVEILWKFYKDGMLSARGVLSVNEHLESTAPLMTLLLDVGTTVATPDALQDFDASNIFKTDTVALDPVLFLKEHPNVNYCTKESCLVNFGIPDWRLGDEGIPPDFTNNPNAAPARRREVHYLITAQTVINGTLIDTTPATARFSVYPLETEEAVRDEMPVREYSR